MSLSRSDCGATVFCSSNISYKEVEKSMRASIDEFSTLSRQSSQSCLNSSAKGVEAIYKWVMKLEIVEEFEKVEDFLKKVNTKDLKKLDLIEYRCKLDTNVSYSHWALYIGDGEIIHFTGDNGGTVSMTTIDYCLDNPCRVNNLSHYAKSKGYKERSYLEVMTAALKDLKICRIKYNLTTNNCGHMATLWKYGVPFNPESATYLQTTLALSCGSVMGLAGGITGFVFEQALCTFSLNCLCAFFGIGIGVGVGVPVGIVVAICIDKFLGYKYTNATRKQLHKMFMIDKDKINEKNRIDGILIKDEDCKSVIKNESNVCSNECNCEIVLYPHDDEVVHMVIEEGKTVLKRHSINQMGNCCKGIDHKKVRSVAYDGGDGGSGVNGGDGNSGGHDGRDGEGYLESKKDADADCGVPFPSNVIVTCQKCDCGGNGNPCAQNGRSGEGCPERKNGEDVDSRATAEDGGGHAL